MKLTSIIAIYGLFWVLSAFLVLPFGIRTHEESGVDRVPGQADSAPANFNAKRVALRASVLALFLFGLYYANYVEGWITVQDLDFFGPRPNFDGPAPG
jgi:predicted secreted protein